MLTLLFRTFIYTLIFIAGGLVVFIVGDLVVSLNHPELKPWHTIKLENEFRASMEPAYDWNRYLEQEQKLFDELAAYKQDVIGPSVQLASSRYIDGGNKFERRLAHNWNRSYILDARNPTGVALVVHGLSDSPYSLKNIAQALNKSDIIVYGLRLPGHGTVPSGLDDIAWQDWMAAVRVTDKHIQQQHAGLPYYYVGYSTGAALGVKLALDAIAQGRKTPDQLFLLSPALGVSPLARFANLQRVLSHLELFHKARWLDVMPEYDPYKYNSFTKNAGRQISLLISQVYADIEQLKTAGKTTQLPRIISFQSLVDATVSTTDLVDKLYAAINNEKSELVLFDVNQMSYYKELIRYKPEEVIKALNKLPSSEFRLTLITNQNDSTPAVTEVSWPNASTKVSERPLALAWPEDIYSLSHTSLPFPSDDPVYGYDVKDNNGNDVLTLGNLSIRGEQGVLSVPASTLLRLRANPFYSYIEKRITDAAKKSIPAQTKPGKTILHM
jgi:alpha-beta hydrolase superfamily lysophospholipase